MKFVNEIWDNELLNVASRRFLLLARKIKKNVSVIKLDHKALLVSRSIITLNYCSFSARSCLP